MIADTDLAYAAALVDNLATLRSRVVCGSPLPQVSIQGKHPSLPWLAQVSGVGLLRLERQYNRHVCTEHCPDAHSPIETKSSRWLVTGARATIVLHNLLPHLREQRLEALGLVETGRALGYKGSVVNDLANLGWAIPDLRPQPRARVTVGA